MKKPPSKIVYRNVTHLIKNNQPLPGFDQLEPHASPEAPERASAQPLIPNRQPPYRDPLYFIPYWLVWLVWFVITTAIVTYVFILPTLAEP